MTNSEFFKAALTDASPELIHVLDLLAKLVSKYSGTPVLGHDLDFLAPTNTVGITLGSGRHYIQNGACIYYFMLAGYERIANTEIVLPSSGNIRAVNINSTDGFLGTLPIITFLADNGANIKLCLAGKDFMNMITQPDFEEVPLQIVVLVDHSGHTRSHTLIIDNFKAFTRDALDQVILKALRK